MYVLRKKYEKNGIKKMLKNALNGDSNQTLEDEMLEKIQYTIDKTY